MARRSQGLRHVILARKPQRQCAESRIKAVIERHPRQRIEPVRPRLCTVQRHPGQHILSQRPPRLPFVERVGVMGQQERALFRRGLAVQHHRRRKAAQDRGDRPAGKAVKRERLFGFRHLQHRRRHHLVAVGVQKAHGDGQHLGVFHRLAGRRRVVLAEAQREPARAVPRLRHRHARRARLGIPTLELRQVAARGILEHAQPILDGRCIAIMPVEIQGQGPVVIGVPHQPLQHPDHLGALFIDRRGVEIVDLDETVGPHGMGQGPAILAELPRAQRQHILDPLHRVAAHVAGELLVAEHGQPFLQAQLKPVAAGDAVTGPVVEILMRDHRLDPVVVVVGGRRRAGQHKARVEDIQPFVLHRAHVEIVDCDDIEHVEIILPPIHLLVPPHRADQTVHRIGTAILVAGADVDVQRDLAPGHRRESRRKRRKVPRHQREQIRGLRPGIVPLRPARTRRHRVAIRQQHRLSALDAHPEHRHHVGAVGVEGDLAKPLGLALRAVKPARHVKAFECRVPLGRDLHLGLQRERTVWQERRWNRQTGRIRGHRQRNPVQRD